MTKVAGIILLVEDIASCVAFYKRLGFSVSEERPETATTLALGDFWVELLHSSKVVSEEYKADIGVTNKGTGAYLQIQVEDVDAFYQEVIANGIRPSSEPKDYPWQQREFILADPEGYKIAFFSMI